MLDVPDSFESGTLTLLGETEIFAMREERNPSNKILENIEYNAMLGDQYEYAYAESIDDASVEGAVNASAEGTVDAIIEGIVDASVEGTVDVNVEGIVDVNVEDTVNASVEGTVDVNVEDDIDALDDIESALLAAAEELESELAESVAKLAEKEAEESKESPKSVESDESAESTNLMDMTDPMDMADSMKLTVSPDSLESMRLALSPEPLGAMKLSVSPEPTDLMRSPETAKPQTANISLDALKIVDQPHSADDLNRFQAKPAGKFSAFQTEPVNTGISQSNMKMPFETNPSAQAVADSALGRLDNVLQTNMQSSLSSGNAAANANGIFAKEAAVMSQKPAKAQWVLPLGDKSPNKTSQERYISGISSSQNAELNPGPNMTAHLPIDDDQNNISKIGGPLADEVIDANKQATTMSILALDAGKNMSGLYESVANTESEALADSMIIAYKPPKSQRQPESAKNDTPRGKPKYYNELRQTGSMETKTDKQTYSMEIKIDKQTDSMDSMDVRQTDSMDSMDVKQTDIMDTMDVKQTDSIDTMTVKQTDIMDTMDVRQTDSIDTMAVRQTDGFDDTVKVQIDANDIMADRKPIAISDTAVASYRQKRLDDKQMRQDERLLRQDKRQTRQDDRQKKDFESVAGRVIMPAARGKPAGFQYRQMGFREKAPSTASFGMDFDGGKKAGNLMSMERDGKSKQNKYNYFKV